LQSKKERRVRDNQSIARPRSPSRSKMRALARNRDAASQGTVPASAIP
jgi:UDP-glucuronate decarboxylase